MYMYMYLVSFIWCASFIRAIDKENKKFRDEARRKYQDLVRALTAFVRSQDPRMAQIEADRRRRQEMEEEARAAKRSEG
jgi:DnaJ family protein A protein 5